jgi:hypothetical protein
VTLDQADWENAKTNVERELNTAEMMVEMNKHILTLIKRRLKEYTENEVIQCKNTPQSE